MQNTRKPGTGRGPGRPPKRGRRGGRMAGSVRSASRTSNSSNSNSNTNDNNNNNNKNNHNDNDNDNNNHDNNHNNNYNGNESGGKSRSVSATTSASSITPSPSSIVARQLRHSTSQKVDYNLKRRKIIPSEDFTRVKRKYTKSNGNSIEQLNERKEERDQDDAMQNQELIERDPKGNIVNMHEPSTIRDALNGATGLPLGQGPPEKVKKEYLWSYKKNTFIGIPDDEPFKESAGFESKGSELLTDLSDIRQKVKPVDIHANQRDVLIEKARTPKKLSESHGMGHIKLKATVSEESKSKLFGQNSVANLPGSGAHGNLSVTTEEIENDDFCSACLQSGSFLCCDTCPKSFHFLCLNPPLDPDELPEGDWSCPQCFFEIKCPNATLAKKAEKDYLQAEVPRECKLFGKLLFQLDITNPRQFSLPQSLKDTFQNVKSGPHGVYNDGREKEQLSEKQLFGVPYGQSLNMLDRYNPDIHVDQETGKFLTCYKCRMTKMGTWDAPEEARLIMRCDYCKTPWHLDCIPHAPRASFKNLGTKWKCPLHLPKVSKTSGRRLAKFQKFTEPLQSCGFKNNGEVEIMLDEITSSGTKAMIEAEKRKGDFPPVAILSESSVKLDFMDKVYRAKKIQREKDFKYQEQLIDKLLAYSSKPSDGTPAEDLMSFVYFQVRNNPCLKKLWDFKELCNVAQQELNKESISAEELNNLLMIKKILESKPKEEITSFLNLGK